MPVTLLASISVEFLTFKALSESCGCGPLPMANLGNGEWVAPQWTMGSKELIRIMSIVCLSVPPFFSPLPAFSIADETLEL